MTGLCPPPFSERRTGDSRCQAQGLFPFTNSKLPQPSLPREQRESAEPSLFSTCGRPFCRAVLLTDRENNTNEMTYSSTNAVTYRENNNSRPGPTRVYLSDLIKPDANQIRKQKFIPATVARYADAMRAADLADVPDTFPPIIVRMIPSADGRGSVPELIVGFHRVAAAQRAGRAWLMAEVVEATDAEARWISAQSNLTHGEPLKSKEHREVFRAYVRADQCWHRNKQGKQRLKSSREIAADLHGLRSHTTIVAWMRQDFPKLWKQMGGEIAAPAKRTPTDEEQSQQRRDDALRLLAEVESIARTLTDPWHRGEVLAGLAKARKALEEAGPCEQMEDEL